VEDGGAVVPRERLARKHVQKACLQCIKNNINVVLKGQWHENQACKIIPWCGSSASRRACPLAGLHIKNKIKKWPKRARIEIMPWGAPIGPTYFTVT
jgi:hypothetical protein